MAGGVLGRSRDVIQRLWNLDATAQDAITIEAPTVLIKSVNTK